MSGFGKSGHKWYIIDLIVKDIPSKTIDSFHFDRVQLNLNLTVACMYYTNKVARET